ncbi:MAG: hypothetical protein ACRD3D_10640 [Terriglobia bacterium]
MKALRLVLAVMALGVAVAALAQETTPTAPPAAASNLHVIVPWTHFGQQPASPSPGANPAPVGATTPVPVLPGPESTAAASSPAPTAEPEGPTSEDKSPPNQSASPQVIVTAPATQLYEADIGKKHPHPPEPVVVPPGHQAAPPLGSVSEIASTPTNPAPVEASPVSAVATSAQAPAGTVKSAPATPEADIATVSEAYAARKAARESRLQQLQASTSKDPAAQRSAGIAETRLELEGEQDRMQTAQTLAQDFAALADEFDQRASKVATMVNDRKQIETSSQTEVDQLSQLAPRRKIALQNLAELPAGAENDKTMQDLQTELIQDSATEKLATARAQEARQEVAALEAEANRLQQAAAKAREKSALCAAALAQARADEDRLADRMEYYKAEQRASELLADTSKVLSGPAVLTPDADAAPAISAPQPAAGAAPEDAAAGSLRECIRKTGKVDACLAKEGGH